MLCAGLTTVDLVQRVAELPGPNEKVTSRDAELSTGGPAAGAALTAAALGAPTTLLSALGRHELAAPVRHELDAAGVRLIDATADTDALPPISAVSVREGTGERSVVSRDGAALASGHSAAELPADPLVDVEADVVLVDGHHPALASRAAAYARERDVPLVLDGGSWKPVLDELVGAVDLAVCSADFRAPGTGSPSEQGLALLARGVRAVAVTRGGDDVLWWRSRPEGTGSGDGADHDSGRVRVPRVDAVDTLGAGDVFHGAVLAALTDSSWPERLPGVLDYAARVAASRVECHGRQRWLNAPSSAAE